MNFVAQPSAAPCRHVPETVAASHEERTFAPSGKEYNENLEQQIFFFFFELNAAYMAAASGQRSRFKFGSGHVRAKSAIDHTFAVRCFDAIH